MLNSTRRTDDLDDGPSNEWANARREIERIINPVRRQAWIVLGMVAVGALAGILYGANRKPLYTASVFVLIDNRRVKAVENAYDTAPTVDVAASVVDSQVEVVKSSQVARAVITKLHLLEDPAHKQEAPDGGLIETAKRLVFGFRASDAEPINDDEEIKMQRAIGRLQLGLDASRLGRTVVLQISYTATSPREAADIANAYAEAYLADEFNAKYEATKRASEWLEERIRFLREKALSADLAVQKFRAENGLISSGGS